MKPAGTLDRLREVSPIAAEARRLKEHFEDQDAQADRDRVLREAYERRAALVREFQSAELTVSAVKFRGDREDLVYEDLSEKDDGGKPIEAFLHVPAFTTDQVLKVYEIAERNRLGVMTAGTKTSALGVFAANDIARMRGLQGVVCLDLPSCWDLNRNASVMDKSGMPEQMKSLSPVDLLQLPKIDSSHEKLSICENAPIAVIENIDPKNPRNKHRVIAHATVTVAQINDYLAEVLPKDAHYQILPDLTSKKQAALGGVIATGAQGGNRASARVDLLKCRVVDALGVRDLEGEDAKMIVGYNGYLGTCVQAEFEVTKFPEYPFGFIVPIRGKTLGDAWQNALKFQARLAPYCVHPDNLAGQPDGMQKTLVSSMEILGPEQLRLGIKKYEGRAQELEVLLDQFPETQIYVYVVGSTNHRTKVPQSEGEPEIRGEFDMVALLKDPVFFQALGVPSGPEDNITDETVGDVFEDSFLKIRGESELPNGKVYPIFESEFLHLVDEIRHSAPEVARAEAEKIGNVTQSTDFNIQFTGTADLQERARARVASLYAKYQDRFSTGPYRVDLYGHLFPGIVPSPKGGGMDPHVRVTLNLSDPDTRNDSPERVNEMKAVLSSFYTDLLRLHGTDGIVVAPPEKSHLTNLSYVKWVRLHNPGMIFRLQERFLDDLSPEDASRRMLGGFRLPIEFPNEPRRGMKSFLPQRLLPGAENAHQLATYGRAVMEISQLSHRGPEVKGMLREVIVTLREQLNLHAFRQHPFFIESVDEGRTLIERNLGKDHQWKVEEITSPLVLEQLAEDRFQHDTFYLIPAEFLGGIPGLCVMITPHKAIIEADARKRRGENKEVFRHLVEMFHLYPYETPETPNIPAIAYLGLALQREELGDQQGQDMTDVLTINPGPTQLHPWIRSIVREQGFLQSSDSEEQQADIEAFRRFMRMPEQMRVGFTGSATQCMQLFGEALALRKDEVRVIQVVNDAFAERMQKILSSHGLDVSALRTPWTTAENSQVEFVANELVSRIDEARDQGKRPILFVTPHKTSTTAHFHPESLVAQLKQRGREMGRDYELVCDITSGAGAIDYFTDACRDGMSVFGSDQKALGCPAGLGFLGLSEGLSKLVMAADVGKKNGLSQAVEQAEAGRVNNHFALRMLGEKCRYELRQQRTVIDVHGEVRQRVQTILGFMALHPDLCHQVPSAEDQSPLLVGMYSISHNLPVALRLMDEMFGYRLGAGYGPFANESLRLYAATVGPEQLDAMLSALHLVLEMPEVTKTVNPKAPIVSLREPHDPYQVLDRLILADMKPDDLFTSNLGLEWIGRLIKTKGRGKGTPYGSDRNLDEIRKILKLRLMGGRNLRKLFKRFAKQEVLLRDLLMNSESQLLDEHVDEILQKMYDYLKDMVHLMSKYASTAQLTPDGRVIWPLLATEEQLKNGNGSGQDNGNAIH